MRPLTILAFAIMTALILAPARACADAASACRNAARAAETRHSIPPGLLQAITLVETGRYRKGETVAWPWTVNVAGKGRYFETRAEAEHFVRIRKSRGAASIDIGCFQINTRWHGAAFETPLAIFEPADGAAYAAAFLARLHAELGDWNAAVRSYHSRDAAKGAAYGEKIAAALERLGPPAAHPARPARPRLAAAPPLREGPRALNSLVVNTAARASAGRGGVQLTLFTGAGPLMTPAAAPLLTRKE